LGRGGTNKNKGNTPGVEVASGQAKTEVLKWSEPNRVESRRPPRQGEKGTDSQDGEPRGEPRMVEATGSRRGKVWRGRLKWGKATRNLSKGTRGKVTRDPVKEVLMLGKRTVSEKKSKSEAKTQQGRREGRENHLVIGGPTVCLAEQSGGKGPRAART